MKTLLILANDTGAGKTRVTGALAGIRIFEFDADGRLLARIDALEGRVDAGGNWTLIDAHVAHWPLPRSELPGRSRFDFPSTAWAAKTLCNFRKS